MKNNQIKKVCIDKNKNILDIFDLEKVDKFLFVVTLGDTTFEIPCSYTVKLTRYYESPIGIKKDKDFKKAISELRKYIKRLNEN